MRLLNRENNKGASKIINLILLLFYSMHFLLCVKNEINNIFLIVTAICLLEWIICVVLNRKIINFILMLSLLVDVNIGMVSNLKSVCIVIPMICFVGLCFTFVEFKNTNDNPAYSIPNMIKYCNKNDLDRLIWEKTKVNINRKGFIELVKIYKVFFVLYAVMFIVMVFLLDPFFIVLYLILLFAFSINMCRNDNFLVCCGSIIEKDNILYFVDKSENTVILNQNMNLCAGRNYVLMRYKNSKHVGICNIDFKD